MRYNKKMRKLKMISKMIILKMIILKMIILKMIVKNLILKRIKGRGKLSRLKKMVKLDYQESRKKVIN